MADDTTTIDCDYTGRSGIAAAYLLRQGDRAAFVEVNTSLAVPLLLDALQRQGLSPGDVEHVIVTHAHLDHAGGAGALMAACPNATLWAHPRAAPHLIDPRKLIDSARGVYGPAFDALYGEILPVDEARVRAPGDEEVLTWGQRALTFLHTRGHANHHLCVLDSGTDSVFTGDSFGIVYPALQQGGTFAFPSTSPTDFDAEAALASVDRIVATGARTAWPTHFGPQTDLAGIAEQLRRQLRVYGAMVDTADASALEGPALQDWCTEQVQALFDAELSRAGLTDHPDAALISLDAGLNAQGIAFAVRKRRFKRQQAATR